MEPINFVDQISNFNSCSIPTEIFTFSWTINCTDSAKMSVRDRQRKACCAKHTTQARQRKACHTRLQKFATILQMIAPHPSEDFVKRKVIMQFQ